MLRHIAEPIDPGWLEADVRIQTAGDRPMDDRLLLLLHQLDQTPLGPLVLIQPNHHPIEKSEYPELVF